MTRFRIQEGRVPLAMSTARWPRIPMVVTCVVLAGLCLLVAEFVVAPESLKLVHRTAAARAFFLRSSAQQPTDAIHELLTNERMAGPATSSLDPVQVHVLWIGELENAPKELVQFTQQDFNVTVHTDVDDILDGFHPYVRKAYELAIPDVVGFDFLKFLLLYKYGGFVVDADTTPQVPAWAIKFPAGCTVIFGKEAHMPKDWFTKPQYRQEGGATYPLIRPYQLLNWAMAASTPRNDHVRRLIEMCMMRFFGLRDMEYKLIQDVAGSGLMTDYFALLHERAGRSYSRAFEDPAIVPVEGACMADELFTGKWIFHHYLGSWKLHAQQHATRPDAHEPALARDESDAGLRERMREIEGKAR